MAELHIMRSLRIIEKHLAMRRISVESARDTAKELALTAGQATELERDRRLREELEKATVVGYRGTCCAGRRMGMMRRSIKASRTIFLRY